jgi:hypothetical protein
MRRTTVGLHLLTALAIATPNAVVLAQGTQANAVDDRWTREELENLLAPIALYPDPILAQVLVAATYPDQVLAAQAHLRAFGSDNIDAMPWEISVKAVAHYQPVLNLLAEGEDWMTALGQAYATQPVDVMNAVQSLRQMANAQGNLQSGAQQHVIVEREVIRIEPAEPRVVYVPIYDPAVVYFRPIYVAHAHPAYWSWGVGYPVGAWLTYDFDWWGHRVYYHGWHVAGPRWVVMSRPWIVMNPIYIAPRHTVVVVNRNVVNRRWSAAPVRRYSQIHRNVTFERHDRWNTRRDVGRGWGSVPADRGRAVPDRSVANGGNRGGNNTPSAGGGNRGGNNTPSAGGGNRGGNGTPSAGNNGNNGNNGRRVGPPDDDQRGTGGRRVGPREDVPGQRVTPLPSGGTTRIARNDTPATPATTRQASDNGQTTRSSNGTWNPRSSTPSASAPRASTPQTSTPRASSPQASTPRADNGSWNARPTSARTSTSSTPSGASAPRASGSPPRASTPSSSPAPRASTPSSSPAPRASAPSSGSAPRASAPRSSGGSNSAPRASAPRSSGGGSSAPRASAPRSSSGGGGAARGSSGSGGSSGRGRGN